MRHEAIAQNIVIDIHSHTTVTSWQQQASSSPRIRLLLAATEHRIPSKGTLFELLPLTAVDAYVDWFLKAGLLHDAAATQKQLGPGMYTWDRIGSPSTATPGSIYDKLPIPSLCVQCPGTSVGSASSAPARYHGIGISDSLDPRHVSAFLLHLK